MTRKQVAILFIIVMLVSLTRMIPHEYNVSPFCALALFSGAHFKIKWQSFVALFLALFVSDILVNNYLFPEYFDHFAWIYPGAGWQYLAYGVIILLAILLYRKKVSVLNVAFGALGGGLLFYLISNFGVWVGSETYPKSWAGLMACYTAGIPFFRGTVFGNVTFAAILFGGYYLCQYIWGVLRLSHIRYRWI